MLTGSGESVGVAPEEISSGLSKGAEALLDYLNQQRGESETFMLSSENVAEMLDKQNIDVEQMWTFLAELENSGLLHAEQGESGSLLSFASVHASDELPAEGSSSTEGVPIEPARRRRGRPRKNPETIQSNENVTVGMRIRSLQSDINEIDSEIERLQTYLGQLKEQRNIKEGQLGIFKGMLE